MASTSTNVQVNKNVSKSPESAASRPALVIVSPGAQVTHEAVTASRTCPNREATSKLDTAKASGHERESSTKVAEYSNPSPAHQAGKLNFRGSCKRKNSKLTQAREAPASASSHLERKRRCKLLAPRAAKVKTSTTTGRNRSI